VELCVTTLPLCIREEVFVTGSPWYSDRSVLQALPSTDLVLGACFEMHSRVTNQIVLLIELGRHFSESTSYLHRCVRLIYIYYIDNNNIKFNCMISEILVRLSTTAYETRVTARVVANYKPNVRATTAKKHMLILNIDV